LNREPFTNAMLRYKKVLPFGAPDFSDNFVAEFWFKQLSSYGSERLSAAMQILCCRNKFPSIDDIRKECGDVKVSDETIARDTAERIYAAIGRFGSKNFARALEYIGEIGDKTIGGGSGWVSACESCTTSNSGIYKAQWRERAKGVIEMSKKGITGPAALPKPHPQIKALLDKASKNMITIGDEKTKD